MVKINISGEFDMMYRELVEGDPELMNLIADEISKFKNNPDDTRLYNHPLTKRLNGKWAFSITSDIRIVYRWIGKKSVKFILIGKHKDVYK